VAVAGRRAILRPALRSAGASTGMVWGISGDVLGPAVYRLS